MKEEKDSADSDIIHPFGDHIDWNESFYFNLVDRKNDIAAFMRIGLKPNSKEKNMFCYFMMPDGSLIGSRSAEPMDNVDLSVAGLRFVRLVPGKEWRLDYAGPMKKTIGSIIQRQNVSFSLKFEAINKVFDYRECSAGDKEMISTIAPAEHTEQFGRMKGELNIDGNKMALDGLSERDHSWGLRDWLAPTMWIWLSCQFSENKAFNITKLMVELETVDAGYFHVTGSNRPIVRADIVTEYARAGEPKKLKLWLVERDGVMHEIQGEILRTAKIPFTSGVSKNPSVLYETLAKYQYGIETGYGIAEFLIREI